MEKSTTTFWHEKLEVYQLSLHSYSRLQKLILDGSSNVAATDHLERALESILENIVLGNSCYSADAKQQYLSVAYGSALECAGCLDIFHNKGTLDSETWRNERYDIFQIVQMLVGLIRRTGNNELRETFEEWPANETQQENLLFSHERLHVYQLSLEFIRWVDSLFDAEILSNRHAKRLDKLSTSIVLNIAEGNGRTGQLDHRKFIDIAHSATLKSVVLVDLPRTGEKISRDKEQKGKNLLRRIETMLLGMRGYLQDVSTE